MKNIDNGPILVAITGASGMIYVLYLLKILNRLNQNVHLIMSEHGLKVANIELTRDNIKEINTIAQEQFNPSDISAPPASGSTSYKAMVILPCSMGSLAAIANGITLNLIHRAADCFLKEKRPLIVSPRETPLNKIHLQNMLRLQEAGATIFPAMPAYYMCPKSIEELAEQFASRIVSQLGFNVPWIQTWKDRQGELSV